MPVAGRSCPLHYRYSPGVLARPAELVAETLYVIGGLYGNYPALQAILTLRELETRPVTLVFNGDFNWFNVDPAGFITINEIVLSHIALRGNVETELAGAAEEAGCGCAYPEWVEDSVVAHSNAIIQRLRSTAHNFPRLRAQLGTLPMHLVAEVGGLRIAIVHGDAESLAGWRFSQEALADPRQAIQLGHCFHQAQVRLFACTHTCLPVVQAIDLPAGLGIIINNGAAGMPNFHHSRYGLITRISTWPPTRVQSLYGIQVDDVYVDALPVPYDQAAWWQTFLTNWPPGSPAFESYFQRIMQGPDYEPRQAVRINNHWCV
jgi:hypothetical protein